jgi:hypothetical protein
MYFKIFLVLKQKEEIWESAAFGYIKQTMRIYGAHTIGLLLTFSTTITAL